MQAKYFFIQVIAVLFLAATGSLHAQEIAVRADTVFLDGAPHLVCKKGDDQKRYEIMDLHGRQLIDVHNSRLQIDGKTAYVVTFLNDGKQSMYVEQKPFPRSFFEDIFRNDLVHHGSIDTPAEAKYVTTHPLPDGYIDVDQIANY